MAATGTDEAVEAKADTMDLGESALTATETAVTDAATTDNMDLGKGALAATDDELLPDPGDGGASDDDVPPLSTDVSTGLSVEECVAKAAEAKAAGNEQFKACENADACLSYQLVVQYVRTHATDAAARELLLSAHTNLAAAQIRLELWEDAAAAASAALALDPASVKAMFRRGLSHARMGALLSVLRCLIVAISHSLMPPMPPAP